MVEKPGDTTGCDEPRGKVVIVMPAYNAEATLEKIVRDLSSDAFD